MTEPVSRLQQEIEKLKTLRDELRVQIDLGKMDLKDAWEEGERKWSHLEAHAERLKNEGADALEEVGEAAELLVGEIKEGFRRVKSLM